MITEISPTGSSACSFPFYTNLSLSRGSQFDSWNNVFTFWEIRLSGPDKWCIWTRLWVRGYYRYPGGPGGNYPDTDTLTFWHTDTLTHWHSDIRTFDLTLDSCNGFLFLTLHPVDTSSKQGVWAGQDRAVWFVLIRGGWRTDGVRDNGPSFYWN